MDLSAIRAAARSKADEQNTDFIPDSELDAFVNQGCRYIHSKIVARDQDYFLTKGTAGNGGAFTTAANTQSYSLPASLMRLAKVECRPTGSVNDNDWRAIQRLNLVNDRPEAYYPRLYADSLFFGYFLGSGQIHFKPVPRSPYDVRLWFVPRFTAVTLPADVPSIPEEYHDLIAEYAAIQCLGKSGEGIFTERQKIMEMELENLLSSIGHRDQASEQMTVTDHEDYEGL